MRIALCLEVFHLLRCDSLFGYLLEHELDADIRGSFGHRSKRPCNLGSEIVSGQPETELSTNLGILNVSPGCLQSTQDLYVTRNIEG